MELLEGVARIDGLEAFLARLDEAGETHGVTVQAFDARYVVDRAHLERAVEFADRAIECDDAIARERGVEIMLYAAGRRQIERALEMGVSEGECPVVLLVDGPGDEAGAAAALADLLADADVLGTYDRERVREFFDVSDAELTAADGDLPGLVRERVALLVVEK
ncbi:MAG: KEOPS complex subunit Cgi121 [Haloarculaceae archaeon]